MAVKMIAVDMDGTFLDNNNDDGALNVIARVLIREFLLAKCPLIPAAP